jgi:hypothetical protein
MKNVCTNILSADNDDSATGEKIDANQLVSGSFHFYQGDATAEGSVKIQASNDPPEGQPANAFTPTNWIDIPNASANITAGAPALIVIPNMAFRWIRAVFTETTPGSTTVSCNMNALSV